MKTNIKLKFNQLSSQCRLHNPFVSPSHTPQIHPALKVLCAIPFIGFVPSIELRRTRKFNPLLTTNPNQQTEMLRADRRLLHFEMAGAVTSVAIAVTFIAFGMFAPGVFALIGAAAIAIGIYRYVSIHQQLQCIQEEQRQSNTSLSSYK